jgi:hypothetical protein
MYKNYKENIQMGHIYKDVLKFCKLNWSKTTIGNKSHLKCYLSLGKFYFPIV